MNRRTILAALVAAATWCTLASSAGAWQQVGSYYRNPYTGSFSYGTYQYNPYTGQNTYGNAAYNPYTGQYPAGATYNSYTNTYVRRPAVYNPYTGRYADRYGAGRR